MELREQILHHTCFVKEKREQVGYIRYRFLTEKLIRMSQLLEAHENFAIVKLADTIRPLF